jgi:hypothetical protein
MAHKIIAQELHRQVRRRFPRRATLTKGLDDLHQMDLAEMIPYARYNSGHKYFLVTIDVYSKFVWTEPLKDKKAETVKKGIMAMYRRGGRYPKLLQTDMGTEFTNRNLKTWLEEKGIKRYSTFSNMKAAVAERVIRTLKTKLWRKFTERGTYKWIDILPEIVEEYNETEHSTIKMQPSDVSDNSLLRTIYNRIKMVDPKKQKFKVGDWIRLSKHKHVLQKGYKQNWTDEQFKVVGVRVTLPRMYNIEDYKGNPIAGGVYEFEMQKVTNPGIYLPEKILKRTGNKLYVKWKGFDSTHNTWINKTDLVDGWRGH